MARHERFTLYVNKRERRLIKAIAEHLDRSQSDAIRCLVRGAAEELDLEPQSSDQGNDQTAGGAMIGRRQT